MSELTSVFSDIATSIRSKLDMNDTMKPGQMSGYIDSIPRPLKSDTPVYTSVVQNISDDVNADNLFANNTNDVMSYPAITFGSTVTSVNNTFFNCQMFNAPVYFDSPSNITVMDSTFANCNQFNQPVTIPMGVTSMVNTFARCHNFNQSVTIPSSVKTMVNTFSATSNMRCFPTLSEGLETMDNVFSGGYYFRKLFPFYKIPSSVQVLNQSSDPVNYFYHEPFFKFSDNLTYFTLAGVNAEVSDNFEGYNFYTNSPACLMANSLGNFNFDYFTDVNGNWSLSGTSIILRNAQPFMDKINETFPGCVWNEHIQNYMNSNGVNMECSRYKTFTYNGENFNITDSFNVYETPNIQYINDPVHYENVDDNTYDSIYKTIIGKNCEGKKVPFNALFPTLPYAEREISPKFSFKRMIPIEFEEGMKNLAHMFDEAYQYMYMVYGGSNIFFVVPNGVTNVSYMFNNMCYGNWNSSWSGAGWERHTRWYPSVILSNTVTDASYLYAGSQAYDRYNSPIAPRGNIIIPDSVRNISHAFENMYFNFQNVILGNGIIDGSYAFHQINHYGSDSNWNITLPSSLENGSHMFNTYINNLNLTIPSDSKLKDMSYMFAGVSNLNNMNNLFIPNSAVNVSGVFYGTNYNKPINLSDNVKDISNMLREGSSFNQPITFGNNIENLSNALYHCYLFNQPVVIPASAKNAYYMLYSCGNFNSSIVFEGYPDDTYAMFRYINQDFSDKIVFNNLDACLNDAGGIMVGYNYSIPIPNTFKALTNTFAYTGANINVNLAEFENLESLNHTFTYSQCNFENGITIPEGVKHMVGTFNSSYINYNIVLPESVENISNMLSNAQFYNYSLTIPNNVKDTSSLFASCYNFNKPITIPEGVENTSNMFSGCHNFNQSVTIPNSAKDISGMFQYAYNFNGVVTLPNTVKDISNLFIGCQNYNQIVVIPEGVENTSSMFYSCSNFNQPITIPSSVADASYMFESCYERFNSVITINNGVGNCYGMFSRCSNYNQPVTIPESVTDITYMFSECYNFNSPVTLLNTNIENLVGVFNSTNFNQPFTIPEGVKDITQLFGYSNYNQAVVVPNSVERMDYLLGYDFENSIVIGTNVTHMNYLFQFDGGSGSFVNDITCYATGIQWAESAFSGLAEWEGQTTFNANNLWGNGMFAGCQFADNITINGDIASSDSMFHSCSSLTEVHLSGNCGGGYYNEGSNEYGNYQEYFGSCSFMFANCAMFNGSLDNVTFFGDCSYMFAGATRFSKPLNFYYANKTSNMFQMQGHYESLPAGIFNAPVVLSNQGDCDMYGMFAGCSRFNQPITIPSNAFQVDNTNIQEDWSTHNAYSSYMFAETRFNSTLVIENGVKYIPCLLSSSNFNQPVVIPDSVLDTRNMFEYANQFNQPVTIGSGVQRVSNMFSETEKFNSVITFNNGITNLSGLFQGAHAYNQPVTIPNSVIDVSSMFVGTDYNQPVTFGNSIENLSNMFYGSNFNQPVNIPNTATNCYNMFSECYNFNSPVNIDGNSPNLAEMFYQCQNFNSPVNINSASNCSWMFYNCQNFNQPIDITLSECNNLAYMFTNCLNLVQPVNINVNNCNNFRGMFNNTPIIEVNITGNNLYISGICYNTNIQNVTINGSNITTSSMFSESSYSYTASNTNFIFAPECTDINAYLMFNNYTTFNGTVTMTGAKFTNCSYMFYNCQNFNQPIGSPDTLGNCYNMFYNCQNFNQPINVESATRCFNMFYNCTNFNQPLTISDNVDTTWMLYNCTNFNSPITFGNNCTVWNPFGTSNFNSDIRIKGLNSECGWLVYNCNSFGANIYIDWIGTNANLVNCISNNTNALQKSFCVTSEATDFMLNQYMVAGHIKPTYEALTDGNGYFNSAYNLYIYNNYIPA